MCHVILLTQQTTLKLEYIKVNNNFQLSYALSREEHGLVFSGYVDLKKKKKG